MKITNRKLKQIIKEETEKVLSEVDYSYFIKLFCKEKENILKAMKGTVDLDDFEAAIKELVGDAAGWAIIKFIKVTFSDILDQNIKWANKHIELVRALGNLVAAACPDIPIDCPIDCQKCKKECPQ